MKFTKIVTGSLIGILLFVTKYAGGQNLLVNGSFEWGSFLESDPSLFPGRMQVSGGTNTVTGWNIGVAPGGYVWWLESTNFNPEDGSLCIDLDSNGNQPYSYVEQTFATVPGQPYQVSGYFGSEFNGGPAVTSIQINGTQIGISSTGSGNYGGTTFDAIIWTNKTFYFVATSKFSTLRLQDETTATGPNGPDNPVLDNFSVEPVPFFSRSTDLGAGWNYMGAVGGDYYAFGYYDTLNFPWIYHVDLGWMCFVGAGSDKSGAYFYDYASGAIFYTEPAIFPYLYDFKQNAWIYCEPRSGANDSYYSNPRGFLNLTTGVWTDSL